MNIIWGILNLVFAIGMGGAFALFGVAMYAMAHDSPSGPDRSLKWFAQAFLLLMVLAGGAIAYYLFRNACFYFDWAWCSC